MHEGHRSRLVGKIRNGGTVYEHELLEVLLFSACPRRDLNATAHALINRFGDLNGVLSASVEELATVSGVGKNMAQYVCCIGKELKKAGGSNSFAVLSNTSDFKKFLLAGEGTADGHVEFCMMDKDGRMRRKCTVKEDVSASEILKLISVSRPYGLFVANRRKSASAFPSADDDKLVSSIFEAAKLCGARFYDYCVVASGGEVYSYFVSDRSAFGHNFSGGYNEG
ncbi:MAG: hypothetical protein K2K39_01345 [Clostridia bacterium]|nr:hypothetical protein [Clostridia bacterium]